MTVNNRRALLIADEGLNKGKLLKYLGDSTGLDLFPLFPGSAIVDEIRRIAGRRDIVVHNSAALVDEQVSILREEIILWSAKAGDSVVFNKTLKEWFILPFCNVSSWWFSFFSEKSPLKTDVFLKIAQLNAIERQMAAVKYDRIIIFHTRKNFRKAVRNIARKYRVFVKFAPISRSGPVGMRIKKYLDNAGILKELMGAAFALFIFLKRKLLLRFISSGLPSAYQDRNKLLFISYFPAIEKKSGEEGIFVNNYAAALQDKLKANGRGVNWLLMYVPLDGYSFTDAVKLANKFIKNGEKMIFLESFLGFKEVFLAIVLWIRQLLLGLVLFFYAGKGILAKLAGKEKLPVIKSLWQGSFYGAAGMEGILYYLIFRNFLKRNTEIKECLYLCEMHAWEKALIAARNAVNPNMHTIGFQHTAISRNYFSYYLDRSEFTPNKAAVSIPLPDTVASSGKYVSEILLNCGYPSVARVEALRALYLEDSLSVQNSVCHKKNNLLVLGSIDKNECTMMAKLVNSAFPRKTDSFEIRFRAHPSVPFEPLFRDLGISDAESRFIIKQESLTDCLAQAAAVLVSSSSLTIAALAFGCEIIVPVFPNVISVNPLIGLEKFYRKAACASDLSAIVDRILSGELLASRDEYRVLVRKYWDIAKELPGWSKLLNLNSK